MCNRILKTENSRLYYACSDGLSILEVLIAVAIVSFVFIPAIQILYSIQPKSILDILSGPNISIKDILFINKNSGSNNVTAIYRKQSFEKGDLLAVQSKGGIWKPYSLASTLFSRQSCSEFNINNSTGTPPRLFTYTKEELDISTSTVLTGVTIVGQKLYLSANSSSTTEPDIFSYTIDSDLYKTAQIFNASVTGNIIRPTLSQVQSEDTGPGISSILSRGSNIITANTGVKSQADILDQDFAKKISYVIPGSNSNTTPLSRVVFYANKFLIVGTEKSILPEIHFFDIETGQSVYSIETGYGINDIVLYGNYLIVAGPRDPEIEVFYVTKNFQNQNQAVNANDPNEYSIGQKIGQYDLPGGSGNAKTLAIFGDNLYVGRTKGGNEFVVLSMAFGGSTPVMFKEFTNKKISWSIDSMLNFEKYAHIFSADEYKEFQLYEILTNGNLLFRSSVDLPSRVSSSMCFKNTIWVTLRDPENVNINQVGSMQALGLIVF